MPISHFINNLLDIGRLARTEMCVAGLVIYCSALAGPLATAATNATNATNATELKQRLRHSLTVTWQGQQLRSALDRLAELEQFSIWLDRRINPNQTISLSVQDLTVGETLAKLARVAGGDIAYVEGVVYVGPKGTALEIAALREKSRTSLARAPQNIRKHWLKRATWSWPRLSEPKWILQRQFSSGKIELHGLDQVPHDLWPARQLPPLARVDRSLLALYGFDLTLQIDADGKRCRIIPIKRPLDITRQVSIPSDRRSAEQKSHQEKRSSRKSDKRVYSLRIREKKVGDVLRQLAGQLQLDLKWDEQQLAAAGRTLETRISCEVESADLDQLLESVLAPAGLQFKREGTVVRIEAREE